MSTLKKSNGRAKYLTTLVYLDEPQLVLLKFRKSKIIGVSITSRDAHYPFFGAEINDLQLERYLRQFTDLRFLFTNPKYKRWYKFNLDDDGKDFITLETANLDDTALKEYIPDSGFFSREHTSDYKTLDAEAGSQVFYIDGNWGLRDFSSFYAKITDLYSFFSCLEKFNDPNNDGKNSKKIKDAFINYPWKGGSSYVNFFKDLFSSLALSEQPDLGKLQYASPGFVEVTGSQETLSKVKQSINNYGQREDNIAKKYSDLYKYLLELKLLSSDSNRFDKDGAVAKEINKKAAALSEEAGFDAKTYQDIYSLVEGNSLASAKIVLALLRRILGSNNFFVEGRVGFERINHTPNSRAADW